MIRFLALLLCLVTLLWGCQRTTTVILPPETTTVSTSGSSDATAKAPAETPPAPATEPAETDPVLPTVASSAPATTEPTAVPTEAPSTAPTAEPTTAPSTEPATEPTTEPATEPITEPVSTQHPVYDISGHSIGTLEYGLLDTINQQRAASDLPALTMDPTLCALAAIRSYECTESFSHTRSDGRGAFTVLSDYGYYIWSDLNERIHYGSSSLSADSIVKGWMYTTDFPPCILSGDFTHIGIGIFENGGITYITCFFAG